MKLKYLLAASVVGLSAAAVLPAPVMAQQITSGIGGTVTDESGKPIAGATVTVTDTRTGVMRTLTTGSAGNFLATNLVVGGPYTIKASATGFEGQTVNDVTISTQGNTSLSFKLASGAGAIVVTAARANVTQLAVGPSTSFGTQMLEEAPSFDRDIRDVIRIDPRVTLDRDSSSGQDRVSCLGGNDRSNAFTVDGISQADAFGLNGNGFASRSSTPLPYSAIRETSVEFAPYDVEYGQFTGCAINVITKSGSNHLHGNAFFEYSDNGLRGTKFADKTAAPVQAQKNWGASLGGPIIPDRLFFFGAYSHQETGYAFDYGPTGSGATNELAGVTLADFQRASDILKNKYGIDTGGLVTNLPYHNDRYFARIDAQITDGQRLELTYQHLDESTMKQGGFYTGFGPTITGADNFYKSGTKSNYYSGRLYSDWTDNFSTEIRYAHSDVHDIQDPVGGGEAQSGNGIPRIDIGTTDGSAYGAIEAGPDQYRSANALDTKIDNATLIGKLSLGDHNFKFGGGFNRVHIYNLFIINANGTLVFNSIDDLEAGILADGYKANSYASTIHYGEAAGAFGGYTASGDPNDAAADFTRTIYSLFAQDDWQMNDRLSGTFGLRVDFYNGGHPTLNPNFVARYGYPNTTGFSDLPPVWMPRAALTYDLDDFGPFSRPKLRLGAGIFSGGDPLVWFGNAFQNNGVAFANGSLTDPQCSGLSTPVNVLSGGQFTGVPSCVQQAGSAYAAQALGKTQSIDPNIKMASVLRFNLGWESDLDLADSGFFSGWNLKLDFIYSHFMNPFGIVDLSQIVDPSQGLNGYTSDGRPIYAPIDPSLSGCTAVYQGANPAPQYSNVNDVCFSANAYPNPTRDDELMLTNLGSYNSSSISAIVSKHFDRGIFTQGGSIDFTAGYAYTDGNGRATFTSSTASGLYDLTGAFDRQNLAVGRAIYSNAHRITMHTQFTEEFFGDYKTRLGITFTAHSGRPYSLVFSGHSPFNSYDSNRDNALLYIPSGLSDPNVSPLSDPGTVQALHDFAQSLSCAKKYEGMTIKRNTCDGNWYVDMDLSLSQEIPGPGSLFGFKDKLRLYATMDNFLNFLNKDWNVLRQRTYTGLQTLGVSTAVDSQGRYILTGNNTLQDIQSTFDSGNYISTSGSVWRLKIGLSYNF